jgi:type IV pilus assembly protein PilF
MLVSCFRRSLSPWLSLVLALVFALTSPLAQAQSGVDEPVNARASGGRQDLTTSSDESPLRKRARIRLELATAYFSKGDLRTALDEVKQVLSIDSNFSEALELRGLVYDALQEPALAEESFGRALQANPRNGSAMHNYAWFLCRKKDYDQADAMFARAQQQGFSVPTAKTLLVRGVCQIESGKVALAEKTIARSYELDPSSAVTAYNLARVLMLQGEAQRARFYIRRVNNVPEQANAESLWLGIRIENKLGNVSERDELASALRSRFGSSREATALELGRFDE